MKFDVQMFLKTLPIMLYGMVGILLVIGVIYVLTLLLTVVFSRKKKEK